MWRDRPARVAERVERPAAELTACGPGESGLSKNWVQPCPQNSIQEFKLRRFSFSAWHFWVSTGAPGTYLSLPQDALMMCLFGQLANTIVMPEEGRKHPGLILNCESGTMPAIGEELVMDP